MYQQEPSGGAVSIKFWSSEQIFQTQWFSVCHDNGNMKLVGKFPDLNQLLVRSFKLRRVNKSNLNMKPYKNKINPIRKDAWSKIVLGFVIMNIGIMFREHEIIRKWFMKLGILTILGRTGVYAWVVMLSPKDVQFVCQACGK